jgi:8-oxo-dGTP pyrophosphatase MutT (NUDIX family)
VARLRRATATSAGGIVVRLIAGVPYLVAGRRRRERDGSHGGSWTLPKGTPNPSETLEETAVREVAEETGLEVRIVAPIDRIEYVFVQGGARIHKTVHYWLMEPTGGDLAGHDHEFDEVRWVPLADAGGLLTFDTERALVERAAGMIAGADEARA